jgi:hypothetical protein
MSFALGSIARRRAGTVGRLLLLLLPLVIDLDVLLLLLIDVLKLVLPNLWWS